MTIASTTSKVSYNGSGSTGPFPITYKFTKNADIAATKRSGAGVETVLALTTDYTLTGAGDAAGGALTLTVALAVGESLVIARAPGIVQEVDYVENSAFPAETHEGALDLLTTICQSLQEQVDRSVKVEISSTTSPDDLLAEIAVDVAVAAAAVDAAETAQGLAEDARDAAIAAAASVPTFGAFGLTLAATTTASNARASLVLGTAAEADTGTGAGDVPVLDAGGKIAVGVLPSITGTDPTARDIAVFDSLLNQIGLTRASGAIPSGYMHLFATDELATKTNATYISGGRYYHNQSSTTGSSGLSVSATAPGGYTFFDRGYKLPAGATVDKIGVYSSAAGNVTVKIALENTTTNHTVVVSQTFAHSGSGWEDFTLTTPYVVPGTGTYRLGVYSSSSISMNSSGARSFVTGDLMGTGTTTADSSNIPLMRATYRSGAQNMTLIPAAITAGAAPATVDLYLLHKPVVAVTLNTDIKARVSRDNGSTWSGYVTLAEVCQYDAEYKLLKGTADLSALPSGTSVKWEITTLNTKNQQVRAAAMILNI